MRKIALSLIILMSAGLIASAKDTYAHDASVLPAPAQNTLKNNFKAKVSVVKIDKDLAV